MEFVNNNNKKFMSYSIQKRLSLPFAEAVEKVKSALQEQGFGILTEIDVKDTLQKKLGVDYKQYVILGACNPPRAFQALQLEEEIGLLLPCNVIVYEQEEGMVVVSAIKPTAMFSIVRSDKLASLAQEVEDLLTKVISSL